MKTRRGEVAASGGPAPKKKRAPPKKFSASEDAAIALVGAKGLTMAWLDEALGSSRERSSNRWRRAIKSKIEDKTVNHIKSKSTTELPLEEIALEVVRDMHHQMPQAAFNREIAAARAVVAPLVERFEKEEAAKAAAAERKKRGLKEKPALKAQPTYEERLSAAALVPLLSRYDAHLAAVVAGEDVDVEVVHAAASVAERVRAYCLTTPDENLKDALVNLDVRIAEATECRSYYGEAITAFKGASGADAVADANVTLIHACICSRRADCRASEAAVGLEARLPSTEPRSCVYVPDTDAGLPELPDADWPGVYMCWCQVAGFAAAMSHICVERDGKGAAYVNYAKSNLPALAVFWDHVDFSSTPHGGRFLATVDATYVLKVLAHQDRVGRDGAVPAYCHIGSAALAALDGAAVGTYASDAAGSINGKDVCVGACEPGARVTVYVADVKLGRATVLVPNNAVPGIPRGAVLSLTTRALDAVGSPLSRAARKGMSLHKLADETLKIVLGAFVFPFVNYLGDGGTSKGECAPAKMMREGSYVAACIDALSNGRAWFDHPILLTCVTPNFSEGCLDFAVFVALWAAAPLLGVEAPTTHAHQTGRAAIECAVAAAAATDGPCCLCTRRSGCRHGSSGRRSAAAALVLRTVAWGALTDDDRARVERFFATGPTANTTGLKAFKELEASPAFAPLVAELKGVLQRRAAPFSQNIRKAFEVLVGAARVKDSVRRSEEKIAANEAKLREDDPMDID